MPFAPLKIQSLQAVCKYPKDLSFDVVEKDLTFVDTAIGQVPHGTRKLEPQGTGHWSKRGRKAGEGDKCNAWGTVTISQEMLRRTVIDVPTHTKGPKGQRQDLTLAQTIRRDGWRYEGGESSGLS